MVNEIKKTTFWRLRNILGFIRLISLQMELKPHNVFVTLAYPPDTNTPGLESENLTKPAETKAIAESSGLLEPKQVAASTISALKVFFQIWYYV